MIVGGGNNAYGELYEAITLVGATSCKVTTGHTFGNCVLPFRMTIFTGSAGSGSIVDAEIVEVTAIAPDTGFDIFTIVRAKEGTSATTHAIGKTCENRVTYGAISENVGNLTYTEDNYVSDNESATESIDALDVGLAAHVAESASKHIYASGTDYIKFDDGTMICSASHSATLNVSTALPNGGYRSSGVTVTFPTPFKVGSVPDVVAMPTADTAVLSVMTNKSAITNEDAIIIYANINSGTSLSVSADLIAYGIWK